MEIRCAVREADAGEDDPMERRNSPRLNMYLAASVCWMGKGGTLAQERIVTVNVSEEGAYLLGGAPQRPGSTVILSIALPRYRGDGNGPGPVFYCEALVVRVELFRGHAVSPDDEKFGFAVKFRNGARFPLPEAALMGAPRRADARGPGIGGQAGVRGACAEIGAAGVR